MPDQNRPPVPIEMVLRAIDGKAAERGLRSERVEDNMVRVIYDLPREKKDVVNDSQAFRSIVERVGNGDWRPRLQSLGESGYLVEVIPPAGRLTMPASQPVEFIAQVPPGPVLDGQEIDLDNEERIKELAAQLQGISTELAKILGSLAILVSFM